MRQNKGAALEITQEHVDYIRALQNKAEWLAQSDRPLPHQIKEIKKEAEIYGDVAEFLDSHLKLQAINEQLRQS